MGDSLLNPSLVNPSLALGDGVAVLGDGVAVLGDVVAGSGVRSFTNVTSSPVDVKVVMCSELRDGIIVVPAGRGRGVVTGEREGERSWMVTMSIAVIVVARIVLGDDCGKGTRCSGVATRSGSGRGKAVV